MGDVLTMPENDRPIMAQVASLHRTGHVSSLFVSYVQCLAIMNCGMSLVQPKPKPDANAVDGASGTTKSSSTSLHPDWYAVTNKNATGEHDKVYYVNRKTKAVSWKKILAVGAGDVQPTALHPDWYAVNNKDSSGEHDKVYYVNRKTKAVSWKSVTA